MAFSFLYYMWSQSAFQWEVWYYSSRCRMNSLFHWVSPMFNRIYDIPWWSLFSNILQSDGLYAHLQENSFTGELLAPRFLMEKRRKIILILVLSSNCACICIISLCLCHSCPEVIKNNSPFLTALSSIFNSWFLFRWFSSTSTWYSEGLLYMCLSFVLFLFYEINTH